MPVLRPCCAALSRGPPQVCSTSSRWAAMARMSRGWLLMSGVGIWLGQASLLNDYILADDGPVRGHLPQGGKDTAHVLVGVHKRDHHRQLSAYVSQMGGLDS